MLKKCVITGSNQGIGYSIIEGLLKGNTYSKIIMTSREKKDGEEAISQLRQAHSSLNAKERLELLPLELLDQSSILNLAKTVKSSYNGVDCFIHNAGFFDKYNSDNAAFEMQWSINYANTRVLNERLLEQDAINYNGRIIYFSSARACLSIFRDKKPTFYNRLEKFQNLSQQEIDLIAEDYRQEYLSDPVNRNGWDAPYNQTKTFGTLYFKKLAKSKKILEEKKISVFNVIPGHCRTKMTQADTDRGIKVPRSQEKGAETPIYLAELPFVIDPKLQGGLFFDKELVDFVQFREPGRKDNL